MDEQIEEQDVAPGFLTISHRPVGVGRLRAHSSTRQTTRCRSAEEEMSGPRISVRPSLTPSVYARRPIKELPWPLNDPSCRLYARARHGIWHGLKSLGLQ